MVNKDFISKTFEEIISKHSDFLYNIEGTLREITDTKEEYKTLRDDIWKFWKETKGLDHEEIIIKADNGSYFENKDGTSKSVAIPDNVMDYLKKGGRIEYTIHNHPSGACIQSLKDFNVMTRCGVKYSVSSSEDGLMIIKNPNYKRNRLYVENVLMAYRQWHDNVGKSFFETYGNEIQSIAQKYYSEDKLSSEQLNDYHNEIMSLFKRYQTKNANDLVDDLNGVLNERIYGIKGECKCFYVPRSPRIK